MYHVSFAGHHLNIGYNSDKALSFLNFLFGDLLSTPGSADPAELTVVQLEDPEIHRVSSSSQMLYQGPLGVQAAAILYDAVIFSLLNNNSSGIALHAGAVSYEDKLLIIPGESGAGKSSVVAWLTSHGFSYVTDELIFFPDQEMISIVPFTRPVCLKTGSARAFSAVNSDVADNWLSDEFGAIVPHRFLNSRSAEKKLTPALILFPSYQEHTEKAVSSVSAAQASTRLMGCCANGRNLNGHGFKEIVTLSRSLLAFELTFSCFDGLEKTVEELVQTHQLPLK